MNARQPISDALFREVHHLADGVLDGALSDEQCARLDRLVCTNAVARQLYVRYVFNSDSLRTWSRSVFSGMFAGDPTLALDDLDKDAICREISNQSSLFTGNLGFHVLGTTLHTAFGYFSSDWSVSYLIATVIMGIGALIAGFTYVSHPVQIAEQSPSVTTGKLAAESQREYVGRITGMVDCKWADPSTAALEHAGIPLGRKYALTSGLMEITYHNGAKVILQGPVTYEVESPSSGFLSIGKLTGKVENKSAKGFSVRTPTVTVTDLGTEFGVTVSEGGLTQVHVLQGAVDAQVVGLHGDVQRRERVVEGQAVQVRPKNRQIEAVAFAPRSFTRKLEASADNPAETTYIQAVLADRPMGYWPLNEPPGARKFLDRSGNGIDGCTLWGIAAGQPGPLPGNSRAVALNGHEYIDFGCRNQFAMEHDFTVEAWVWIGNVAKFSTVVAASGGSRAIGWGLGAGRRGLEGDSGDPVVLHFRTYAVKDFYFPLSGGEALQDRWIHVAVVYDRANTAHLYVNGTHRGSLAGEKPVEVGRVWLTIGCADLVDWHMWRGRIAHVAVYPRALSGQQIQTHYGQRNQVPNTVSDSNRKETP